MRQPRHQQFDFVLGPAIRAASEMVEHITQVHWFVVINTHADPVFHFAQGVAIGFFHLAQIQLSIIFYCQKGMDLTVNIAVKGC